MPPIRRSRLMLTSHRQGPTSRCGRKVRRRRHAASQEEGEGSGTFLPDDILGRIFAVAGLDEPATVVRCAATCRRWAGVIARDAPTISRTLLQQPPLGRRLLPDLAIGFFHQENDGPTARTRKRTSSTAEPSFVPTASGRRRFGLQQCFLSTLVGGGHAAAGILDYSRPVASRNGRLVVELRREAYGDGLKLCVCNLTTGDTAVLPPLSGEDTPTGYYACALLTGEDLEVGHPCARRSPGFFRLLVVYNRRGFTALRCYSSDTGCWGRQARKPGGTIASATLRRLGPAVVVRGVAYWSLEHAALLGVRLTSSSGELHGHDDVRLLVYATGGGGGAADPFWDARLLGVSPEGRLTCITASPRAGDGVPYVTVYLLVGGNEKEGDGDGDSTSTTGVIDWEWRRPIVLPQLRSITSWSPERIKMRWFCEKSGIVLFTLGGSRTAGTYALNLETHEVETLVDGQGSCWRNFCGYEIDHAAYLKSLVR